MLNITNLPDSKTSDKIDGLNISNLPDAPKKDPSELSYNMATAMFSRVPGGIEDYAKYLGGTVPMWHGKDSLDEARARNQKFLPTWRNSLAQAALGTIVGGTLENIGHMVELFNIANILKDTEYEWGSNALQQTGHSLNEWARDKYPVYQTKRAAEGGIKALADKTYYPSHFPSIASSVALMIPSAIAGKVATGLVAGIGRAVAGVKYMNAAKTLAAPMKFMAQGTLSRHATKVVSTSFMSRHMYSYTESMDNYRTAYEHYKGLKYTDDEAHELAATSASHNYKLGYLNILKDAAAWHLLFKWGRNKNRLLNMRQAAAAHSAQYKGVNLLGEVGVQNLKAAGAAATITGRKIAADLAKQSFLEGFEEYNIQWQKKEGHRVADIAAGVIEREDSDRIGAFMDRIKKHTVDPHTFDSFFWGSIGGLVFGSVGLGGVLVSQRQQIKSAEQTADRLIKNLETLSTNYKLRSELIKNGNLEMAAILDTNTESHMVGKALANGTIQLDIEMLKNLSGLSDAQLTQTGFPAGVQSELKAMATRMEVAATRYNQFAETNYGFAEYDTVLAATKAAGEYGLTRLKELKKEYQIQQKEISSREALPEYMNPAAKDKLEATTSLKTLNRHETAVNRKVSELKAEINHIEEQLKQPGLDTKTGVQLSADRRSNLNVLRDAENSLEHIGKLKEAINSQLNAANSVLTGNPELENINNYIEKNSDISATELGRAIENIDSHIVKEEADLAALDTQKGQTEFVNALKEQLKQLKDERRIDFQEELKTVDSKEELELLHKKYDMEFGDLYKIKEKEIAQADKVKKKETAFNKEVQDVATKIDRNQTEEVQTPLTKEEQAFYDNNKTAVDAEVQKRVDSRKPVDPKEASETPKSTVDTIISDIKPTETFANNIPKVVNEDGTIKPFSPELLSDVAPHNKSVYTLSVYEYIASLIQYVKNSKQKYNHPYAAILKQFVADHPSIVKSLLDKSYSTEFSTTVNDPSDAMIKLVNKEMPNSLEALLQLNTLAEALKAKFKTETQTFANKTEVLKDKLANIVDEAKKLLDDPSDAKESKDLKGVIAKKNQLVSDLVDVLNEFYSDVNTEHTITLKSLYELLIDLDMVDFLKENHNVFRQIFDLGAVHSAKIIQASESNKNLYIDFRYRTVLKNISDPNFIDKFIDNRQGVVQANANYKGVYLYLHDLVTLSDTSAVDNSIVEKVEVFTALENGDTLSVIVDPTHVDPRYTDAEQKTRGENSMTVPVKIVSNKTGKDVELGFLQTDEAIHNGIPYKDKDGNFNPFSNIINSHDIDTFVTHRDVLQEVFNSVSNLDKENASKPFVGLNNLPTDLQKVLKKLLLHNRSETATITNENVRRILESLFYNKPDVGSLNHSNIKQRYANHYNTFKQDYQRTVEIRNLLANGETIEMTVSNKSASPKFLSRFGKTVKGGIAPITINGQKRIVLAKAEVGVKGDRSGEIYDTLTGQRIQVKTNNPIHHTKTYSIHEVSPGVYHAYTLLENTLDNTFGRTIILDVLDRLKTLSLNTTKEGINDFHIYTKSYIKPSVVKRIGKEVIYDSEEGFSFKVNRWSDTETSITFKVNNVFYEVKYNTKKDTFQIAKSDNITTEGQLITRTFENTSANEVAQVMKGLKRGNYVDKETRTFGGLGEFTAYGKTYSSYTDFLIETDGFVTNLDGITNEQGDVISNFIPRGEPGSGPYTLHANHNVVVSEAKAKQQELTTKAEPYLGKTVSELLSDPTYENIRFLTNILDELGITVRFNNKVTKGKNNTSQSSVLPISDKLYQINLHERFFIDNNGNELTKYDQISVIIHEILHPIIDGKEQTLTAEQKETYMASLKEFREGLREYLKEDNKTLNKTEKDILSQYLNIAELEGKHSETITYAFAHNDITRILSKLSNAENTSEGFWNKLLNIIADLFGIDKSSKLGELAGVLDRVISMNKTEEIVIGEETKTTPDTKSEVTTPTIVDSRIELENMRNKELSEVANISEADVVNEVHKIFEEHGKPLRKDRGINYIANRLSSGSLLVPELKNAAAIDRVYTLAKIANDLVTGSNEFINLTKTQINAKYDTKIAALNKSETAQSKPDVEGIDHFSDFESREFTDGDKVYNEFSNEIANRYGLSKIDFVKQWNDLTYTERLQELKCL